MKNKIIPGVLALFVLSACGRSNHNAPTSTDFTASPFAIKSQDGISQKADEMMGSLYGTNRNFRVVAQTDISQNMRKNISGLTLHIETQQDEISGETIFITHRFSVQKLGFNCLNKENEIQVYKQSDLLNPKSNVNMHCLDLNCENLLLILEAQEKSQHSNLDYGVVAVALKKDKDSAYRPQNLNSQLITQVDSYENGVAACINKIKHSKDYLQQQKKSQKEQQPQIKMEVSGKKISSELIWNSLQQGPQK